MTIVEFYDKVSVENIVSGLLCAPNKVILVGDSSKKMQKSIRIYEELVRNRGIQIAFSYKAVSKNNLSAILKVLTDIVEENGTCIFDLSGGEDLYLVAVGMLAGKYGERIQLHRFNIQNNVLTDCDTCGNMYQSLSARIGVEENIRIYGGKILYAPEKSDGTFVWDLNEEFIGDVLGMWEICRENTGLWNTQINTMDRLNSLVGREGSLEVELDLARAKEILEKRREKFVLKEELFQALCDKGIIRNLKVTKDNLSFIYKNEQVKKCLTKAGQILEMYITVMAKLVKDEENVPVYNDVMTGVYIDWDGRVEPEKEADVTNEIDVMLMKGMVPVFISCKNGFIEYEELYKLSVVAGKFGGRYAKKVLIASGLDRMGMKAEYIRARAEDMNIRIVENVDEMSQENLSRIIKSLWKN